MIIIIIRISRWVLASASASASWVVASASASASWVVASASASASWVVASASASASWGCGLVNIPVPGMKDFISVLFEGKRQHVQKRLVLCNLREAYEQFKQTYPDQKIGFSKFAELRPKECVLARFAPWNGKFKKS